MRLWRFNLHKTNAANEELVISLFYGREVQGRKSVVAIMRPFGEIVSTPFEIKHTASDIHSLIELINSVEGESRIVMEHTGRYYEVQGRKRYPIAT